MSRRRARKLMVRPRQRRRNERTSSRGLPSLPFLHERRRRAGQGASPNRAPSGPLHPGPSRPYADNDKSRSPCVARATPLPRHRLPGRPAQYWGAEGCCVPVTRPMHLPFESDSKFGDALQLVIARRLSGNFAPASSHDGTPSDQRHGRPKVDKS